MTHSSPRSILITGGSSGIGLALALHYAAPGVFLAISGQNPQRLEDAASQCRARGAQVEAIRLSVTDRAAMEDWIISTDERHPLDLVIANAGISGGTGAMAGEPADQVRQIFDVNLTGVLNTFEPAVTLMLRRKTGQIAVISSMAGFRGFPSAPAYSASKGAVRFYGEAMRGVLAPSGVKVNVVCPGFVVSRITDANDFPMPFLMQADRAAAIIAGGLARNQGRIAFPFPVHLLSWFLSVLPDTLAQKIVGRFPAKSHGDGIGIT